MATIDVTEAQIDSEGRVIQVGTSLGEREGCTIVPLDEEAAEALAAALSQPNGGLVLDDQLQVTVLPAPEEPAPVDMDAQRQADLEAVQTRAAQDPDFAALARLLGILA